MAIDTGEQVAKPIEHPSVVYSVKFSPDGSRIVTACRDGQARVFDWKTGKILGSALKHEGDVFADRGADADAGVADGAITRIFCAVGPCMRDWCHHGRHQDHEKDRRLAQLRRDRIAVIVRNVDAAGTAVEDLLLKSLIRCLMHSLQE